MEKPWLETYKELGLEADIALPADNTSMLDVLERSFQQYGHLDAYIMMDKKITFQELDIYTRKMAAYLQSLGLEKGDRVAIMLPNILQYPVIAMSILRSGFILVNVNPLYTTRELEHQLHDSGAKVLFILENFATTYQKVADKTIEHVVICRIGDMLGKIKGFAINNVLKYVKKQIPEWHIDNVTYFNEALNKLPPERYARPQLKLTDIAVLQYTGGTTGVSKGATLTHQNLVANMLQIDAYLVDIFKSNLNSNVPQDLIVCALPLYHIFSFMVCCIHGAYGGRVNLLIPNPRDIPGFVKELSKYKPTVFPAVNTLFNALVHDPNFQSLDFSNLKVSIGGGMSVQPFVAEQWHKTTGVPILEGYGMSETSPVVTVNPASIAKFTGKIGMPLPSTDVVILDDDEKAVEITKRGEICVKGPQVMLGYWNNPEATQNTMTKSGYLKTGDIGIMDKRGFIKIVDRKKDMILVSGFNVYPNEIEEVISNHPKVLEVGAIGIPDEKSGEVPKIYIVRSDDSLTIDEIKVYSNDNLTGYKRPRHFTFVDELPKSNVGKILRKELRKLHDAE